MTLRGGTYFNVGIDRSFEGFRWKAVLRADPCAYCGGPSETIDHIEARGAGGRYAPTKNGAGACRRCNGRKKHESMLLFMLSELGEEVPGRPSPFQERQLKSFFKPEQISQMSEYIREMHEIKGDGTRA